MLHTNSLVDIIISIIELDAGYFIYRLGMMSYLGLHIDKDHTLFQKTIRNLNRDENQRDAFDRDLEFVVWNLEQERSFRLSHHDFARRNAPLTSLTIILPEGTHL